ncbi:MAG: hypothetical protein R3Y28_06165 [Candidatus Gastranaerophilales bacterium]
MLSISRVEGYNVKKLDDNKYSIAVNNGNMGARLTDKAGYDQFIKEQTEKGNVKPDNTIKNVLIGTGLLASLVTMGVLAKKGKLGDSAKEFMENIFGKAAKNTDDISPAANPKPTAIDDIASETPLPANQVVNNIKSTVITDIVENGKVIASRKVIPRKEGYNTIVETFTDESGSMIKYKSTHQFDNGASAGYVTTAQKLDNGNWETIIQKGNNKEKRIFSPDKNKILSWELLEQKSVYESDTILDKIKWANENGIDINDSNLNRKFSEYRKSKKTGFEYVTKEKENFTYSTNGNITHVEFNNSGNLVDRSKCTVHTVNFDNIVKHD